MIPWFVRRCGFWPHLAIGSLFLLSTLPPLLGQAACEPGQKFFGQSNYVEYLPGNLPVIVSVPHGGSWAPRTIPNRTSGEYASDSCTEELGRTLYDVFHRRLGRYPHVVICRLKRTKVDCNRDLQEGAGPHPGAKQAWRDFHHFIELARSNVLATTGRGLYLDVHGQSHRVRCIELGYCLTAAQLTNSSQQLNQPSFARASSIRSLAARTERPFSSLLRGSNSLGGLLAASGFLSLPSPAMPHPGITTRYFNGGFNVRRYGSSGGGSIDGIQMELNLRGLRDTPSNRTNFAEALATALQTYFTNYYHLDLTAPHQVRP